MVGIEGSALADLLSEAEHLPYGHWGSARECAVRHALGKIGLAATDPTCALWSSKKRGRCLGVLVVRKESWDTEHFGFGCARVEWVFLAGEPALRYQTLKGLCGPLLQWCGEQGLSLVVNKTDCIDVPAAQAFEDSGFRMVTSELVWVRKGFAALPNTGGGNAICIERLAAQEFPGIDALGGIFATDRFHADFRLPAGSGDKLWSKTLVNACRGFADQVIVAHERGAPLGVVVCKLDREAVAVLGRPVCVFFLVGVATHARGKGLGTRIIGEALSWAKEYTDLVEVGTQAHNYAAVKLYQKAGFSMAHAQYSQHLFINN